MSLPRLPGTPNRHKPRFNDDCLIMTDRDKAILRAAILFAIKDAPVEVSRLAATFKLTTKQIGRVLYALRAEHAIVRFGYAARTQYGLPRSAPLLAKQKWVDDTITAKRPQSTSTSWWAGATSRQEFTMRLQARWSNGSKSIETRVVE